MLADKQMTVHAAEDTDLAFRLRTAVGRLSRRLRATAAGTGLTPTQISVLFTVVRRGPVGLSELARLEDLNPTMLSRVLAQLVEGGLLTRTPDPADRRAMVAEATAAGVALRRDIQRERADALGKELERLGAEDRAALDAAVGALERLVDQLGERLS
jgi:DNA-binding MarR family transcriptional regulator